MRHCYHRIMRGLVCAFALAACAKPNPAAHCTDSGTCTDPSFPFCDVDGVIGGEPGTCIAVSCTAGQFAMCDGNNAIVCNANGNNYDTKQCEGICDPMNGCAAVRMLYIVWVS